VTAQKLFGYHVTGPFIPKRGEDFGCWGFAITLDALFWADLRGRKMTAEEQRSAALTILSRAIPSSREELLLPEYSRHRQVSFEGNSAALCGTEVSGNATILFREEHAFSAFPRDEVIVFNTHNVDSPLQAWGLLALFQTWYEAMCATYRLMHFAGVAPSGR
jgi:hypothetical protein